MKTTPQTFPNVSPLQQFVIPQVIVAMTVLRKDKDEPGAIGCLGQGGTEPEHRLNPRRHFKFLTFYKFLHFAEKYWYFPRCAKRTTQLLDHLHVRLGTSPSDRRAQSRSGLNCWVGLGWQSVGGSSGTPNRTQPFILIQAQCSDRCFAMQGAVRVVILSSSALRSGGRGRYKDEFHPRNTEPCSELPVCAGCPLLLSSAPRRAASLSWTPPVYLRLLGRRVVGFVCCLFLWVCFPAALYLRAF